jgi:hypothetical protein
MIVRRFRLETGCLLVLLAAGCQGKPSPVPSTGPSSKSAPYATSFTARNWSFHLRRLGSDSDEGKAAEVWRDLFVGIAEDAKTRSLLRQLHGNRPVEFVVLDAKQADDAALSAPPPDGYDFVMRLADLKLDKQPGGDRVRVVAYGHVTNLKDATTPTASELGDIVKVLESPPSPGDPLRLAMQDYVLRHAPDWAVISGPYFREETLPHGVEELRRELDKEIKECEARARDYYGSLSKRP